MKKSCRVQRSISRLLLCGALAFPAAAAARSISRLAQKRAVNKSPWLAQNSCGRFRRVDGDVCRSRKNYNSPASTAICLPGGYFCEQLNPTSYMYYSVNLGFQDI